MATKVPSYKYVGGSHSSEVKDGYWYIYLKGSGTLTLDYAKKSVDVFLVGGGGGAAFNRSGGGGGGYTKTVKAQTLAAKTGYSITVGAGGTGGTSASPTGVRGGTSSATGINTACTAAGGYPGIADAGKGGDGGSGGGGGTDTSQSGLYGLGGYNGGDGYGSTSAFNSVRNGKGQGTITRAFEEETGTMYAGGGSGGYYGQEVASIPGSQGGGGYGGVNARGGDGEANTGGGGGGGGMNTGGGNGGSGIVIIRGKEDDLIPVWYNGVQLAKIFFNGVELEHLSYGGKQLYARVTRFMRRWRACLNCPEPEFA